MTVAKEVQKYQVTYGGLKSDDNIGHLNIKFTKAEITCPKHGVVKYSQFGEADLPEMSECPDCKSETQKAREIQQAEFDEQQRRKKIFYQAGIPKRFKTKNFDNYIVSCEMTKRNKNICQQYANKFQDSALENGTCITMVGNPGTGKTHLACAIANQILFDGTNNDAVFSSTSRIMRDIKDSWNSNEHSENEIIRYYIQPELLIVDEVGVQFGSDTEKNYLFDILNARYEEMRPTILISNLKQTELADFVGERILDRFKEGGGFVLDFTGESNRGSK